MPKTHESDLEQHVLKHLKGLGSTSAWGDTYRQKLHFKDAQNC